MIIGIDAKAISKTYTGIAVYVHEMINWFCIIAPENEYVLFSNRDFVMPKEWKSCKKVIYDAKTTGSIAILYGFKKLVKKYHIDVFWGPEHCIPIGNIGCKKVVTFHDLALLYNAKYGTTYNALLQKYMVNKCAKAADQIIAISQSTKNDIKKLCKDYADINVIYNGDSPYTGKANQVKESEKKQIVTKFNLKDNYFLYCGTIEPRKNIITIIRAYNQFRKTTGINTQLILCGKLGWKYKKILREIDNSQYRSDIILTGYVTNLEREFFYRNAIALLFPSYYEGFGFPLLEAMSCGIPVITANNSSLPEVGGDVAFYLKSVEDYDDMSMKMEHLYKLTEIERLNISKKCIEQAGKFSRKKCAVEILKVFESV